MKDNGLMIKQKDKGHILIKISNMWVIGKMISTRVLNIQSTFKDKEY